MTTEDILRECPANLGYERTMELRWFTGRFSMIDDEKTILAQRMTSILYAIPDVWVAIPNYLLQNAPLQTASGTRASLQADVGKEIKHENN